MITIPAKSSTRHSLYNISWPVGAPAGDWTFEVRLLELELGEVYAFDVKHFTVQP
jgi:hypothetical protein